MWFSCLALGTSFSVIWEYISLSDIVYFTCHLAYKIPPPIPRVGLHNLPRSQTCLWFLNIELKMSLPLWRSRYISLSIAHPPPSSLWKRRLRLIILTTRPPCVSVFHKLLDCLTWPASTHHTVWVWVGNTVCYEASSVKQGCTDLQQVDRYSSQTCLGCWNF